MDKTTPNFRLLSTLQAVIFLLFFGFGLRAQSDSTCKAEFLFNFVDQQTAYFFNASPGYAQANWDFGDGVIVGQYEHTILVEFSSDTTEVCLEIWQRDSCYSQTCKLVYRGSPEEQCMLTDCVWPGDANGDRLANHIDVLNIGLGYNEVGIPRPFFPFDNPIAWVPNLGIDWAQSINGVNFKHLDCDGNGHINEADLHAILQNYSPAPIQERREDPQAVPLYIRFRKDQIVLDDPEELVTIEADIYLGAVDQPVDNLEGVAFSLTYPNEMKLPIPVDFQVDTSLFGPVDSLLLIEKDLSDFGVGRFDVGIARKSKTGIDGAGRVGTAIIVVTADIIFFREEERKLCLNIGDAYAVDSAGVEVPVRIMNDSCEITISRGTITTTSQERLKLNMRVFPNPATDEMVWIAFDEPTRGQLTIFDLNGREIQLGGVNGTQTQVNLSPFGPGVYILQLVNDSGVQRRRIVVK